MAEPPGDKVVLSMLKLQWPLLVQSFTNINKTVHEIREAVCTLSEVSTRELKQLELQLDQLKGLIGTRNEERGASTMFYSLKNNENEIESLLIDIHHENKFISLIETKISVSKQDVLSKMLSSIYPIIELFSKFSSVKNCPGVKLRMN